MTTFNPLAFDSVESLKEAIKEDGLKRGWKPILATSDEAVHSAVDDILTHYGAKGMKWGVRKARNNSSSVTVVDKKKKIKTYGGKGRIAHPEAIRVRTLGQVAKKSGVKALSNKELEEYNRRLNLEQQTQRLSYQDKNPGQKFVAQLLGQTGKTQAQNVAKDVASVQVRKHITKRILKGG